MLKTEIKLLILSLGLVAVILIFGKYWDSFSEEDLESFISKKGIQVPAEDLKADYRQWPGLTDLKAEPGLVLVSFWASWCSPCIRELKDFVKLDTIFDGSVLIVALGVGETEASMNEFRETHELTGPGIYFISDSEKEISDQFQVANLPYTLIADAEGNVMYSVLGIRDWLSNDFKDFIDFLAMHPKKQYL